MTAIDRIRAKFWDQMPARISKLESLLDVWGEKLKPSGRLVIAIDGPSAAGKGTLARRLAAHFGLPHLDTGLLYRAVGRQVSLNHGNPDNPGDALQACQFPDSLLDDPDLRSEATGGLASRVSVHPGVRQALYERQRAFATQPGGGVGPGVTRAQGAAQAAGQVDQQAVTRPRERPQRAPDQLGGAVAQQHRRRVHAESGPERASRVGGLTIRVGHHVGRSNGLEHARAGTKRADVHRQVEDPRGVHAERAQLGGAGVSVVTEHVHHGQPIGCHTLRATPETQVTRSVATPARIAATPTS